MAYDPYTDQQRIAQQLARQAEENARQASKRSQDISRQIAQQASDTATRIGRQGQEAAARASERTRIAAGSTGASGDQKRAGLGFFAILGMFLLLPIIALVIFVFVGARLLGG